MRGRKPIPAELAELHGNPRQHPPKRPTRSRFALRAGTPPAHLTKDQRAAWRYAVKAAPPGLLRRTDFAILAVFIVAWDIHRRACEAQNRLDAAAVAEGGLEAFLVTSPKRFVKIQSPYLPIINRQAAILVKCVSELGFTPAARVRTVMPSAGDGLPPPRDDDNAGKHEISTPIGHEESLDDFLAAKPPVQATRH